MSPRYDGGSAGGITALDALEFKGVWNAATNTPALADGVGQKGDYYTVGTAGTTSLDGIDEWGVSDAVVFNGTVWERVGAEQESRNEAVQARRTSAFILGAAFADITHDTTDEETRASVLDHDLATNSDNIIAGEAGTYEVGYSVHGARAVPFAEFRVRLNDTSVLPGSEKTDGAGTHNNTHNYSIEHSFIVTLAAADFVTLQAQYSAVGPTVDADVLFCAKRVRD